MDLVNTFSEFASKDRQAEKATFEAAMVERLNTEGGYKMADLLFDVYVCQRDIQALMSAVQLMINAFDAFNQDLSDLKEQKEVKPKPKVKKKK